jgi:hypothetical protein
MNREATMADKGQVIEGVSQVWAAAAVFAEADGSFKLWLAGGPTEDVAMDRVMARMPLGSTLAVSKTLEVARMGEGLIVP